ncbi:hypothetical protein ACET3Z_010933 [Daucus carota]
MREKETGKGAEQGVRVGDGEHDGKNRVVKGELDGAGGSVLAGFSRAGVQPGWWSKEWGSWLRASPRRNAGGNRSKWLLEDGDGDWSYKSGNGNYPQQDFGGSVPKNMHMDKESGKAVTQATFTGGKEGDNNPGTFQNMSSRPQTEEELRGLIFEERKRQRSDSDGPENISNICQQSLTSDAGFSGSDCSRSSPHFLATLAKQASHSK